VRGSSAERRNGEGVTPLRPIRGSGERRELPSGAANAFLAYFRVTERLRPSGRKNATFSATHFQ